MERSVENTIPILPVKCLKESIDYYVGTLGFTEDWRGNFVGSVSRDGCCIMLSEETGASDPGWVWIGLENARLFEEYKGKGVQVQQESQNHAWAYEMKFEDLDGNVLWLGTEPRKDLPEI